MGPFPIQRTLLHPKRLDLTGVSRQYMTHEELEVIVELVASVKPEAVVEFGINGGRTASVILRECKSIKRYTGVDVKPGYLPQLRIQQREVPEVAGSLVSKDPRVVMLVAPNGSHDLTAEDIGPVDAAFIDGDHSVSGICKDTMLALQNMEAGGILIWHDFHDLGNVDVRPVIERLCKFGWPIQYVAGTWTAFLRFQPGFEITDAIRDKMLRELELVRTTVKSTCA